MTVSVILTSYNHEKYIAEAIESVLNQTFQDFELLIADDGSTDNSREIVKKFSDPRIKFFLHDINRGPRTILAECLEVAQGKYIAIHHSDDSWAVDKLEKQVKFLEENKNYAACFTWVKIIDEDGQTYELSSQNNYHAVFDKENRSREKWLHDLFFFGNCFCHPSVMLRNKKNLFEDLYGIDGLWQLTDYAAWIRLLLNSNLYVLNERLTFFRLRRKKQENTSSENPESVIRSEMELYRILSEYRKISNPDEFLKIFPEAEKYVVDGNISVQYALAKILQTFKSSARKLLALDILFELINDKKTAKNLRDWYGYDEKIFIKENAEFGIIYPGTEMKFINSSLYYDTGEGFSEKNCLTSIFYVRQDGNFFAEFSLHEKNKIYSLRFDPVENEAVSIKIISVKINGEDCKFNAVPPFTERNNYQVFYTYDPKYILNYEGSGEFNLQIQGIFSKEYDALSILNELNRNAEENIGELQKQLNNKTDDANNLQNHLNEIYSSRGYKLLQKYYSARDKLLPKGSMRRLIIKNFARLISNPRMTYSLMNRENFLKLWTAWKQGGLRQVIIRSDLKINSPAMPEDQIQFGNAWLEQKNNFSVPENIVIDILVPIYNAYEFTKKCIDSVYKNTDVKFNLYLIDDCSPDERISALLAEIERLDKPQLMQNLQILKNEENLGFIGSVNRGFKISNNDVVLLNTDTEVPPKWLSRLIKPMLDDEKIASVTPFSNSAEICSFPNFCENNDLEEGLTVAEVDEIFSKYGDSEPCKVPTGVGFCMLMRRKCISEHGVFDTIYGKGYGEENDWCRRTAEAGYKHLHVRNLFVWHKHGASFSTRNDKSRQERLNKNLAILSERYPDYHKLVGEYIQKDPAKYNRTFLKYCVNAFANKNIQGVIFINHSMGGGAKIYQDGLIDELKNSWRVYSMAPLSDGYTLSVKNYDDEKIADFNLKTMDADKFCNLLKALKINWIFINQLLTYPIPKFLQWIMKTNIPYTFFGHDFFAICPHYQLLNYEMKYCNAETNLDKCAECLNKSVLAYNYEINISDWRKNFQMFLDGAKEIIVPSSNTAEIFSKYYSSKITVHEHAIGEYIFHTFQEDFARNDPLTVAVIGSIGDEKGSKIIYALAQELEKISLNIKLLVIGITNQHNEPYKSSGGKFEITGRYSNKDISKLLAKYKTSLVLIPSIWPETYSYTTSEAMYSGYPVMVFSMGAPADRVRKIGGGWILEEISAKSVLKKIIDLYNDREEIINQSKNLNKLL